MSDGAQQEEFGSAATSRDARRIQLALELLTEHWREQPDLDWLAARVGLSAYYLQRVFTRRVGVSPKRFVQHLTRDAARASLADARSLLETAHHCGLSGTARLHDLFIRYEGMTPGEFKRYAAGLTMHDGEIDTPFGRAYVIWGPRGLSRLEFFDVPNALMALRHVARVDFPDAHWLPVSDEQLNRLANAFISRPRPDNLPLCVAGSTLQLKVWEALLAIPSGRTVTYHGLADAIAHSSEEEVGAAIAGNALAWLIPCHRVIQENGLMGMARWGEHRKRCMLAWEGAQSESLSAG